jgi:hypothetical protein
MPLPAKTRKLISQQSYVLSTVENNPKLLDLLEIATSTAQKAAFIECLLDDLSITTPFSRFDKTPNELFDIFTAWFGHYAKSEELFYGIYSALQYRQRFFLDMRAQKRQFIREIGLNWTSDVKSSYFSKVSFVCVLLGSPHIFPRLRLSMFPSWKPFILQNTTGS